jgi:Flp pilus assembly protein TadG
MFIKPFPMATEAQKQILPVGRDSVRREVQGVCIAPDRSCSSASKLLGRTEGSQLVELALCLPIMLVVMIAVADFGQAWNIKQKLANAAREGTRIGASAPTFEATNCAIPAASSPCSVQSAADAVKQYMVNAGLNASCITPNTPSTSNATTSTYTYACNGLSLSITRPYLFTATGGAQVMGSQVSLTYPYTWNLNHVIGLLHQNSLSLPSTISTNSVMPNLN